MKPPMIVAGLATGYGRKPILNGVDLPPLAAGSLTALVGPNAAGKTTLLRALAGLLPARGQIMLGERDLLKLSRRAHGQAVGYMPQSLPQRVALSVIEAAIAAARASDFRLPSTDGASEEAFRSAAARILERLGIGYLAFSRLDELSGGQRQLASLTQAIIRQPDVLLLDEPTSALDPRHQISVMRAIKDVAAENGTIAVVVVHDLNIALRWADEVLLLDDGRLAASGTPERAITPEQLAEVYGIVARVEHCSAGRPFVALDDVV